MSDLDTGLYLLCTLAGLIVLAAIAWLVDAAMKRDSRRLRRGGAPSLVARVLAVYDLWPGDRRWR